MKVCIAQNVSLSNHLALSVFLRSISKYLPSEKEIDLEIITLKNKKIPKDLPKNIKIHEIPGDLYSLKGNLKYSINLYKTLKKINKKNHIDIIHCLYPNSSVLGSVLFKKIISPQTKIIYDIRSPWIEMSIERNSMSKIISPIYKKVAYISENILSKFVDGFIFITEGLKNFYDKKINLENKPFSLVPSGVDLDLFKKKNSEKIRKKYGIRKNDFLIGYVGGISKTRKMDFILKSLEKTIKKNKNYKIMFVGDGDDKNNLEELSKKLGINKNVIFTGKVPYEKVPEYISSFDCGFCHLPNKFVFRYSFPMKILEYLACETPVLASDIEAHKEIKKKIKNIYIYRGMFSFIKKIKKIQFSESSNIKNYGWKKISEKIITFWGLFL